MADSAVVAHPEIRFVFGYTAADGSAGGSVMQLALATVKATPGCLFPKAIALDKYGATTLAAATNTTAIATRVSNYVQAFPWADLWVPEMGILGGATTINASLTFADNGATGDTITRTGPGTWMTSDGFAVGDTVKVIGAVASSGANNVTGPITALTDTVLTFGTTALIAEGPTTTARVGVTAGASVLNASTTMVSLASMLDANARVSHYAWWFTGPGACCGGPYNSATQYLYDDAANLSFIGGTWKSLIRPLSQEATNAKVAWVGDSITRGFDCTDTSTSTVYNGFRAGLNTAAIADGFTNLQWIGTQNNSTASGVATRLHEGVNGDSCVDKLAIANATNAAGVATSKVTDNFGPGKSLHGVEVIGVFLCTNGENPALGGTFSTNYRLLIEQLHYLEPQARFVGVEGFVGGCIAQNPNLRSVWDTLNTEGIRIARTGTSTVTSGDLCDGTHPTPSGYAKMVTDIYPAFKRALQGKL